MPTNTEQYRSPVPFRRNSSARTALLVDLENVTTRGGCAICPAEATATLRAIVAVAGHVQHVVTAAPASTLRRYAPDLAAMGMPWLEVPPGPDSADHELTRQARSLAEHGYGTFWVASADHFFARVALIGHLRVVVPIWKPVSWRLFAASEHVVRAIPHPSSNPQQVALAEFAAAETVAA